MGIERDDIVQRNVWAVAKFAQNPRGASATVVTREYPKKASIPGLKVIAGRSLLRTQQRTVERTQGSS